MAHNVEPMDIDNIESDFDNKENSIHHSNVYPRTPCTEKGYEELDVSELNMKLRYSITPASSPMSKSYTANCTENRGLESGDDNVNSNLTRSLHSAISKGDVSNKSVKLLPLQTIPTEQFVDSNRNASVLRPLDSTVIIDNNPTITVTGNNDVDENLSFPSSSSSTAHTPEATTPTKDIPRNDGGSPIMRGLKSVLNMFRSSQSPIPPTDSADDVTKQVLSPAEVTGITPDSSLQTAPLSVLASTPIAANKHKESIISRRSSPLKESLVFNEDLEKELLWKDETTILFSQEKIPIHKLFFQQEASNAKETTKSTNVDAHLNSTVEYMDISYNDSMVKNKTITELQIEAMNANESDAEFLDCETTFTNDKPDSNVTDLVNNVNNESKPIPTITEIISAINVENSIINSKTTVKTEPASNNENLAVSESQLHDVTTSLQDETTNIPRVKSEEETICIKHNESSINTTSDLLQDINDIISDVSGENDCKMNRTNVICESDIPLDATFGKIVPEAQSVDNIDKPRPDVKLNEPQPNMTFETSKLPTDAEITPSILAEEINTHESSETHNKTIHDSIVLNTEMNTILVKEIENAPVVLDIKNTNEKDKYENTFIKPNTTKIEVDLPANIPLPDDDDIENEKSIGAVVLVEEGTVPLSLDINSTIDPGLEFVDQVESKSIELAKLMDVNNTINDCSAIKDSTENGNKSEKTLTLNTYEDGNNTIPIDMNLTQEKIEPVDSLLINESTNKIDKNSDVQTIDVILQRNTELNVSVTSEQVLNAKENTIQSDGQMLLETQTDLISSCMSKINKAEVEKLEISVADTPCVPDCSVIEKESQHVQESEMKIDNNGMNNTASFADILENKGSQEQNAEESQIYQNVLNETAVISNIILANQSTEDTKANESIVEVKSVTNEGITEKQSSPINISTVEVTSLPANDICDAVNNKPDLKVQNISTEILNITTEITNIKEDTEQIVINDIVQEVDNRDEEILLSEHNSPFVSLAGEIDQVPEQLNLDKIESPFATKTKVVITPPSSPIIVCKGYNFNFDEIDDPFATKTKIRLSPTPDTPERPTKESDTFFSEKRPQRDADKNRRKSQPERKKTVPKKKMNSTFCGTVNVSKAKSNIKPKVIEPEIPDVIENKIMVKERDNETQPLQKTKSFNLELSSPVQIDTSNKAVSETPSSESVQREVISKDIAKEEKSIDIRDIDTSMEINTEENKSSVESLIAKCNETKNTSSSEQSTYYSAGTSSGEGVVSRNVFNLPEIDDMNFNPFVTKSKMRQSPPLVLDTSADVNTTQNVLFDNASNSKPDIENPFETKSKMRQSPPLGINATATLNSTQEFSESSDPASKTKFHVTFKENSSETKAKMSQSPPPNLNATATLNSTQEVPCSSDAMLELKSDASITKINTGNFEFNADFDTKTFDHKDYANISNTTCSSKATDEKDLTVREVLTEDEDTIEGPFLEAGDLNNDDKMSDFDGENVDMMQFSELPAPNADENVDGGELFIDAEAFEFLLNQNKSNVVADSGKESLFLKFDPLFAKRMSSDGVFAALNKKRQSTPKKMSAIQMDASFDKTIAGPSTLNTTHEVSTNSTIEESTEDFNVTVSKPMMVVTPAVNPIVTPRNRTATPPSSNRRSITFTSPAIAVIDRLLSLSANNSLVGHDTTVTHMSREQAEADLALTQLRELLAEKEINVYNLRTESKELKDRLSSMESQMRILESESHDRLKKINDLNKKLSEKTKINKSMAAVVEEYERTIASLIAETEQDKKRNNEERVRLIKERDEQTAHLASMEVSFSDLHSKYEKSKQIILKCKANEDSYKKSIKDFEENLNKMQSNYELLKQHATSKLNHANQELEKMNRSHEAEVLKLNAMIKRKDLHITSLEETLAQKTKANEELTAICDELINKVG